MTSSTSSVNGKIALDFAWKGSNNLISDKNVRSVDLIFNGAKSTFHVELPQVLNLVKAEKFPITCTRTHEGTTKITTPDTLSVTIEQVQGLVVRARIFEKDTKRTQDISLELPKNLEVGKAYTLEVSSENLLLSARISLTPQIPAEAPATSYPQKVRNMGNALFNEGLNNLEHASKGRMADATAAEGYAHGVEGLIRSGQAMHPGIQVPHTKTAGTPADFDALTTAELQAQFEVAITKDKQYECQRLRAARAKNVNELNRITAVEHANSQLVIHLAQALERKGAEAKIPQTKAFQEAARESALLQSEGLKLVINALKGGNS